MHTNVAYSRNIKRRLLGLRRLLYWHEACLQKTVL